MNYFNFIRNISLLQAVYSLFRVISQKLIAIFPSHFQIYEIVLIGVLRKNGSVKKTGESLQVFLNGINFNLRVKGSDLHVFNQIVIQNEFEFLRKEFDNDKELKIVDCGANIGLVTLYLKSIFPHARIICIEPDAANIGQLQKNLQLNQLNGVEIYAGGIGASKRETIIDRSFRDAGDWSVRLREIQEQDRGSTHLIQVDVLSSICSTYGFDRIDILKIDIEGNEFELFKHKETVDYISAHVKLLTIEIHPEFGSYDEIVNPLVLNGFKLFTAGELLVARNERN